MFVTRNVRRLAAAGSAVALLLLATPASFGQAVLGQPGCGPAGCGPANCGTANCGQCEAPCQHWCCPPPYHHCMERPPRICIECGCPKPVCCPSDAPNWGYF